MWPKPRCRREGPKAWLKFRGWEATCLSQLLRRLGIFLSCWVEWNLRWCRLDWRELKRRHSRSRTLWHRRSWMRKIWARMKPDCFLALFSCTSGWRLRHRKIGEVYSGYWDHGPLCRRSFDQDSSLSMKLCILWCSKTDLPYNLPE